MHRCLARMDGMLLGMERRTVAVEPILSIDSIDNFCCWEKIQRDMKDPSKGGINWCVPERDFVLS
jgi:hypothetical protein